MNKSFVAIAIAAIIAGIFTTPAEAVRLRTQPNGISINGLVLNGFMKNGLALNGRSWQGTSVRGTVEAETLSLIEVELAD
ncbi:hypothetical protein LJR030_003652 [Rhizobium sp. LjRoot30]|uniref:hypothetical protein n=1 Tax=Rhizobium sp. LjRoot30 TaxID=3342320 RepID=UPI003ECC4B39